MAPEPESNPSAVVQPRDSAPSADIVILSYNSADYLPACIASVAALHGLPARVIIVDNASRDNSVAVAREACDHSGLTADIIALARNLGCAGGNNVGWHAGSAEFVIFLNPDTEVTPDFATELLRPLQNDATIGITGARIHYPGGHTLQHAGGFVYPNGMTGHFAAGEEDTGAPHQITPRDCDYVTGAGFAIRRSLLDQLDGFDEDYFPAYFEETDLCTRARRLGARIRYVPEAHLIHHESVSLTVNSPAFHRLYQRMRIRYCLKNFTLRDWLRGFIPFEARWMLREPAARGHRLEQFRAYGEGLWWRITGKR